MRRRASSARSRSRPPTPRRTTTTACCCSTPDAATRPCAATSRSAAKAVSLRRARYSGAAGRSRNCPSPLYDIRRALVHAGAVEAGPFLVALHDGGHLFARNHVLHPREAVRRALFHELHGELGAELPVSERDLGHRLEPLLLVAAQRG